MPVRGTAKTPDRTSATSGCLGLAIKTVLIRKEGRTDEHDHQASDQDIGANMRSFRCNNGPSLPIRALGNAQPSGFETTHR